MLRLDPLDKVRLAAAHTAQLCDDWDALTEVLGELAEATDGRPFKEAHRLMAEHVAKVERTRDELKALVDASLIALRVHVRQLSAIHGRLQVAAGELEQMAADDKPSTKVDRGVVVADLLVGTGEDLATVCEGLEALASELGSRRIDRIADEMRAAQHDAERLATDVALLASELGSTVLAKHARALHVAGTAVCGAVEVLDKMCGIGRAHPAPVAGRGSPAGERERASNGS